MSLTKPAVPPEILRAFTSGLGDYVDSGDPLWSLLLNKYIAIEAYNLVLKHFSEIKLADLPAELGKMQLPNTGWRFLAAEGDLYGGCHVGTITQNHPPKLTGFSTDAQILTLIEGYNGLDAVAPPKGYPSGDFEPRVLRIPWLQFEAFWLHSAKADKGCPDCIDYYRDWFVPYSGFIGFGKYGLELMKPFTAKQLF